MLASGTTPRAWSEGPYAAVLQAHADSDMEIHGPGLTANLNVPWANGRDGREVYTADEVLAAVQQGSTAILGGDIAGLPWDSYAASGGHDIAALEHDASTGEFLVGDPSSRYQGIQRATWSELSYFFEVVPGKGSIILD